MTQSDSAWEHQLGSFLQIYSVKIAENQLFSKRAWYGKLGEISGLHSFNLKTNLRCENRPISCCIGLRNHSTGGCTTRLRNCSTQLHLIGIFFVNSSAVKMSSACWLQGYATVSRAFAQRSAALSPSNGCRTRSHIWNMIHLIFSSCYLSFYVFVFNK